MIAVKREEDCPLIKWYSLAQQMVLKQMPIVQYTLEDK